MVWSFGDDSFQYQTPCELRFARWVLVRFFFFAPPCFVTQGPRNYTGSQVALCFTNFTFELIFVSFRKGWSGGTKTRDASDPFIRTVICLLRNACCCKTCQSSHRGMPWWPQPRHSPVLALARSHVSRRSGQCLQLCSKSNFRQYGHMKSRGGKSQRREEKKKEDQKRESLRRKKIQVREKVGKSQNTVFFQWFVAPEGRKVGSLKRRVRSHLARWEMNKCTPLWREAHVKMYKTHQVRTTFGSWDVEKVHAVVERSTFPSVGPLLEVEMSKKCTPLRREAHF